MRRREFIAGLGSAATWPVVAAGAQGLARRVGVLTNLSEDDPVILASVAAFQRRLEELGWSVGRNIQIDYRWNAEDPERGRRYASSGL
jgi:putative ABC transport system substrate-binding protein